MSRQRKFKTLRNVISGRIKKGDRLVSITFTSTNNNKWTLARSSKFIKDYHIKLLVNEPEIIKEGNDFSKSKTAISSITYILQDRDNFKKFKIKKNDNRDISVKIGNIHDT